MTSYDPKDIKEAIEAVRFSFTNEKRFWQHIPGQHGQNWCSSK